MINKEVDKLVDRNLEVAEDILYLLKKRRTCPGCATLLPWKLLEAIYANQIIENPRLRGAVLETIEERTFVKKYFGREMVCIYTCPQSSFYFCL